MNGRRYRIEYAASALADLDALPSGVRIQVLREIERLQGGLVGIIKRLRQAEAAFRLRMGDDRIVFDVEGDLIVVR